MLPNLIIIGAMKCGTTSLHYYLNLHPEIRMSRQKELDFFIDKYNWHKGHKWYQSHFIGSAKIHGESSPNYTNYPKFPNVPERIHKLVPQAKLIYLVRDPISRTISHYIHQYSAGFEDRSIEEAFSNLHRNKYLRRSMYYMQLEQFLSYYLPSQILVISTEDLCDHRQSTLHRIFEFLQVNPDYYSWQYKIQRHSSGRKRRKTATGEWLAKTAPVQLLQKVPQNLRWPLEDLLYLPFSYKIERPRLSEALRQDLVECLKEDVNKLRCFTGCDFKNWCV